MNRVLRLAAAAACLVIAACTPRSAAPAVPPTADAAAAEPVAAARDIAAPSAAAAGSTRIHTGFTAADVRFMQDMIGHHAQAIVMAALAPTRGAADMVLKLAQKIDISQRDEIVMMTAWLVERGQSVPDEHHLHGMQMPGMLTPAQLAQLGAARGADFDRLFLTFMIQHHEGALQMVDALFASPNAAQDSDLFRFVTDVVTDQSDEIDVMTHMLELLAANRGSESG